MTKWAFWEIWTNTKICLIILFKLKMHNISDNWESLNSLLQTFQNESTHIYPPKFYFLFFKFGFFSLKLGKKRNFSIENGSGNLWEPRKIPGSIYL